eukprot:365817-Chlamydomonas_euryale.AAC.30
MALYAEIWSGCVKIFPAGLVTVPCLLLGPLCHATLNTGIPFMGPLPVTLTLSLGWHHLFDDSVIFMRWQTAGCCGQGSVDVCEEGLLRTVAITVPVAQRTACCTSLSVPLSNTRQQKLLQKLSQNSTQGELPCWDNDATNQ